VVVIHPSFILLFCYFVVHTCYVFDDAQTCFQVAESAVMLGLASCYAASISCYFHTDQLLLFQRLVLECICSFSVSVIGNC